MNKAKLKLVVDQRDKVFYTENETTKLQREIARLLSFLRYAADNMTAEAKKTTKGKTVRMVADGLTLEQMQLEAAMRVEEIVMDRMIRRFSHG